MCELLFECIRFSLAASAISVEHIVGETSMTPAIRLL